MAMYGRQAFEINTKTIGNRKKIMCVRLRSEDKHHLRKSSDRKAHISPMSGTNAFLICAFRSEDFLRWCLSPECNLTHNLFFLFPIVFGIILIHFFRWGEGWCSRKFDRLFRCFDPLSRHLTEVKRSRRVRIFWQIAKCFEKCNVFGKGKCELSATYEGRNWGANFCQGKVQNCMLSSWRHVSLPAKA